MAKGGDDDPSDVSKSRTLVSNEVEMTVSIDDSVKQARNLPFGANDISTMGDDILALQSTSVISQVTVFTTMTELSEVDKNTSGCRVVVRVRESAAIAMKEKKWLLNRGVRTQNVTKH